MHSSSGANRPFKDQQWLRILQWNAGGFSHEKRTQLMSTLISQDIDVFIIVEANLSHDSLKLHTFGSYCTKILPKSRRIASGILVGVRKGLISDFHEISILSSYNGAEIIKLDVWKRKRHFRVYGCYSPPGNTKLDFSLLTFTSKTILCGDFNAHSKRWNYSDLNSAGKVMEDLLIADQMELLYNDSDIPTYLHYNGNGTNPDLTLASTDIAEDVEREVICDPGSGHRMIITGIGFDTSNSSKRPFRNRWNFAKADWKNFTLENETIFESVSSFCKGILFNIFINDLPDLLASDGLTNTALFADDLAIWCSTPKRDQSKLNTILNLTLERLHLWCIENNMTVNLKKTTCQFFTLNRQSISPQLVYNGMPVQQSDVSIYLGCALDNKLKWTKHAELVVSKARKRLSILKRLTGVKWGCNRDTLNTTYKTYIQPVLNYCNEVLISASENVRKLLDTFHNQALRMITGGVKTTPVLAMQLLCDLQPFTNIIEKNAAILFNRLIRLPNNSFWRYYDSDGGRNLKTQKGFIQCVRENIQYKVINDVPFELLSFANPLDYATLDIRLDLVLNVRKRDLSPTALHAIALETINTRFPPEEWLHIYTDGSLLDFAQGAGIGVFSHLFSFYLHAGPLTTHFDDSTSALQALSNYNQNNCVRVQNCRELLGKIKEKIVFQWVPSHCGLWGNETADFLAKKGTGILQNFRRDLTLHSAKLEIKRIFRESFRLTASRVARDKPWSTLCKKSHGIPSSSRAAAVAKFRLLTGHDCLCAHLFRFNLVTSPICVLCDTGQDMTAAHLDECSALNDLNCIVKRYWRARCLMT
ncbi:uncharacterized protein LOC103524116 [Trichonephila clavipes]|nr:uncharacterized protein LOC103524116 [Trichonephila clavipes]